MDVVWQEMDAERHFCHSRLLVYGRRISAMTTTHSILETVLSLGGVAALLSPAVVLMERTHRRAERAAGRRATRTTARDDADARRTAGDLAVLSGGR
jgi:hypothetical protein